MTTQPLEQSYLNDKVARRNALILAIAMTLSSCSSIIVFSTAGIVGTMLSPIPTLITLPISAFVVGTALATIPASLLMGKVGRKPGFMIGTGFAFCGGMLSTYALFEQSFVLFCFGTMLLGSYMAFTQYYRFAAADRATENFKGKAISWVMIGGIGGAVFGTQIVSYSKSFFDPVLFAGAFLAAAVLALLAFALISLIDIPLVKVGEDKRKARPMKEILKNPRLRVAVIAGMVSYGVMNLLMTATPIAMVACGFSVDDSLGVIQWHVLAMYVPSFFTGHLIARFGVERIIFAGLFMLVTAAVIGLMGITIVNFYAGLIMLGLGWNFGFIGATTMVTQCYEPSEKSKVQAFNDFAVFGTVFVASLSSGQLFAGIGWNAVNIALFPMVAIAAVAMIWLSMHTKRQNAV